MHYLKKIFVLTLFASLASAQASELAVDTAFNFERLATDGITLGQEVTEDRLIETDLEFELTLEYPLDEAWWLFFTGTLFAESEVTETIGDRQRASGLERDELGITYSFGDVYDAQLTLGRVEFVNDSEWWIWWDESLDSLSLQASYGD